MSDVNDIPLHSRRLAESLLQAYCARICPPAARHTVRLAYRIDDDRVTLQELQRICGVPGTAQPVPVAEFRYRSAEAGWRMAYRDRSGHWRAYPAMRARTFLDCLREFDRDPEGRFWTRVDGKSLRWCSSRGRCADCELRYCEVLGITASDSLC